MSLIIVFGSLLFLITLHELGHFLLAKRFGVRVEEFGLGLPPRLTGIRIRETLYSLNLLPLGAFVRLEGEEGKALGERSYSSKPLWQRSLIVGAGVIAFWLVSFVIFTGLGATTGVPTAVQDDFIGEAQVQVLEVLPGSPAAKAGIRAGDILQELSTPEHQEIKEISRVSQVQEFTSGNLGKEIIVKVLRSRHPQELPLRIEEQVLAGQGPLGVVLANTAFVSYPWYEAPIRGALLTGLATLRILGGLWQVVVNLVSSQGLPQGVEFMGIVGIVALLENTFAFGWSSFLSLLAVLSLYLAIFNALPIPAVDGGKLLFLALEAVRGKPVAAALEQRIHATFFIVLIVLLLFVTIHDINRLAGN